jgi:hypothetical protein
LVVPSSTVGPPVSTSTAPEAIPSPSTVVGAGSPAKLGSEACPPTSREEWAWAEGAGTATGPFDPTVGCTRARFWELGWRACGGTSAQQPTRSPQEVAVLMNGDGTSTKIWTDHWLHGRSVMELAPNLTSLVSRRTLNYRT